jgi:hypothetical protein
MGHGMAHLECKTSQQENISFYTDISGEDDSQLTKKLIMKDKIGLRVLFYPFEDGHIQTSDHVRAILSAYYGRKIYSKKSDSYRNATLRFMKFNISDNQCDALTSYYKAFKNKSFGEAPSREVIAGRLDVNNLRFALNVDSYDLYRKNGPAGKLGGGCTSFVIGFLKVAGIFNESWDEQLQRTVYLGAHLFSQKPPRSSIFNILYRKKFRHWTSEDETFEDISFYDPQKIWNFMDRVLACSGSKHSINSCDEKTKQWLNKNNYISHQQVNRIQGVYHHKKRVNTIYGSYVD